MPFLLNVNKLPKSKDLVKLILEKGSFETNRQNEAIKECADQLRALWLTVFKPSDIISIIGITSKLKNLMKAFSNEVQKKSATKQTQ
jgi:hypothetical protein